MNEILKNIVRKLSSRKLWMAIAVVGTGVSVALGADASEIQTIAGSLTALLGAMTYIVTEGKIDAANVTGLVDAVADLAAAIENPKE